MRWIRELFKPKEKCARVGHNMGKEERNTWRNPHDTDTLFPSKYVAMKCDEERTTCIRCGHVQDDWKIIRHDGYTGYTWPAEKAERFRRDRILVI